MPQSAVLSALLTQFLQICGWLRNFREPALLLVCSSGRESDFPKLLLNYYHELLYSETTIPVTQRHHLLQLIIQTEFAHLYWLYIAWLQAGCLRSAGDRK